MIALALALAATLAVVDDTSPPDVDLPARGFGRSGQLALVSTGSSLAALQGVSLPTPFVAIGVTSHDHGDGVVVALNPGLDFFVADHVSLGGEVLYAISGGGTSTTYSGASLRIGYDAPLGHAISLWLRIGGGGERISSSAAHSFTFATFDLPLVWHPSPGFFFGLGPSVTRTLATSDRSLDATLVRLVTMTMGGVL